MVTAVPIEVHKLFILQAVFHAGLVFHVITLLLSLLGHKGRVTHALMPAVMLAR